MYSELGYLLLHRCMLAYMRRFYFPGCCVIYSGSQVGRKTHPSYLDCNVLMMQYFEEKYPDKRPLLPVNLVARATVRQVRN